MGRRYRDLVRKHSKVRGSNRSVLNMLADYADDDGVAWPGVDVLMNDTGLSDRQVQRCLASLVQCGQLEIVAGAKGGRGVRTRYQLVVPEKGDTLAPFVDVNSDSMSPYSDQKGDKCDIKRVTNVHQKGDKCDNAYIEEPTIEPEIEPKDAELPNGAPLVITEWQEFIGGLCWVCYGHKEVKALTAEQKGQLTAEAKRIKDLGYSIEGLRIWFRDKWQRDWRWKKDKSRPTPSEVRSSIPSINAEQAEGFEEVVHIEGNSKLSPGQKTMQNGMNLMRKYEEARRG